MCISFLLKSIQPHTHTRARSPTHACSEHTLLCFPPLPPSPTMEIASGTLSAVTVDTRCHAGLSIAVTSMLRFLPLAAFVTVWQNDDMKPYVNTTIASSPALRAQAELGRLRTHTYSFPALESLTTNLYGPDHFYNRLLTSAAFWRQPQTDWVLIFQSDTIVCRAAPLDLLLRYPYLGGPSGFVGSDAWVARRSPLGMDSPGLKHDVNLPEEPRSGFAPVDMHMNGGLSIHNVTWSLGCIERYHDAFKFVEDDLWNHCRFEQGVQVAERDMYAFASDNGLTGCFTAPLATGGTGASQRVCPWGANS